MTNYSTGHDAEKAAADYLQTHGYKILQLNWSTKHCEIDIVAQKSKTVYFVEVKYRKNTDHGSGFDYITSKKLAQMKFAAEMWVAEHGWAGDYQLAAMSSSDDGMDFLDEL